MPIGIGFEVMLGSGAQWRGGAIHFENWMQALRATFAQDLQLFLVEALHGTSPPSELLSLVERVVEYPSLERYSANWAINHARRRLLKTDLLPDRILKQHGIAVLICGVLERHTSLPTLALLTDFQHRHLPEYFDAREIAWRDAVFHKTAARATRILVSGESVRADFETFAPAYANKASVIPPISFIPETIYARPPAEILNAYALPQKFVYMPNQFWRHKNHLRAFEAIRILKEHGQEVFVVCTGYGADSRSVDYFSEVLQTLSRWNIRDRVALLGSVPRPDVFALVRQAAFVLNPSLFEGYGLSLDEARSIGKRALASDLPAHREQNVPCIEFFNPHDAEELAAKMSALWESTRAGPDEALESNARAEQPIRTAASAQRLMNLIHQVLS